MLLQEMAGKEFKNLLRKNMSGLFDTHESETIMIEKLQKHYSTDRVQKLSDVKRGQIM